MKGAGIVNLIYGGIPWPGNVFGGNLSIKPKEWKFSLLLVFRSHWRDRTNWRRNCRYFGCIPYGKVHSDWGTLFCRSVIPSLTPQKKKSRDLSFLTNNCSFLNMFMLELYSLSVVWRVFLSYVFFSSSDSFVDCKNDAQLLYLMNVFWLKIAFSDLNNLFGCIELALSSECCDRFFSLDLIGGNISILSRGNI